MFSLKQCRETWWRRVYKCDLVLCPCYLLLVTAALQLCLGGQGNFLPSQWVMPTKILISQTMSKGLELVFCILNIWLAATVFDATQCKSKLDY